VTPTHPTIKGRLLDHREVGEREEEQAMSRFTFSTVTPLDAPNHLTIRRYLRPRAKSRATARESHAKATLRHPAGKK
jgi:hypothetical protein